MYSPKISEDLIPALFREARARGIPMTKLVDQLLRQALAGENCFTYADDEAPGVFCVAETQTQWKEDTTTEQP